MFAVCIKILNCKQFYAKWNIKQIALTPGKSIGVAKDNDATKKTNLKTYMNYNSHSHRKSNTNCLYFIHTYKIE